MEPFIKYCLYIKDTCPVLNSDDMSIGRGVSNDFKVPLNREYIVVFVIIN